MAEFTFPANDYERTRTLLAVTGSWWSEQFDRIDQSEALVEGTARRTVQTYLDTIELFNSVSRLSVPILQREQWFPLVLTESERNGDVAGLARYDGEFQYDQTSPTIRYDRGVARPTSSFPFPQEVVSAPAIFNRILLPSLSYVEGVDYKIQEDIGVITFTVNPFDDNRIPKVEVFEDGEVVDRQVILWVFRGHQDLDDIYLQFGYVINLPLPSSAQYRDLVNAVFDGLVEGTTLRSIQLAVAALTGVPLTIEQQETVERIEDDGRFQLVITDQHVYRFKRGSTVVVSEGDTVQAGEPLTDTIQVFEFQRGQVPAELVALSYGDGLVLNGVFLGDLTFENKEVPLTVEQNFPPEGKTRVEWALGGFPGDVEAFFDLLHTRGVTAGQTMANLLDIRENPETEPGPASLPLTINPLEFLIQNVFRSNTFVVKVKISSAGEDALGLGEGFVLRKLVPPWTLMVVLAELSAGPDRVTMDGPGLASDTEAGYEEDVVVSLAMGPVEESLTPGDVSERVTIKQIGGRCV